MLSEKYLLQMVTYDFINSNKSLEKVKNDLDY